MRALTKGIVPTSLQTNGATWTTELLSELAANRKPTLNQKNRYNQRDIKQALVAETGGKCAYCESKIRHISFGDIEHIVPKIKVPQRSFDWSNLTLACQVCNQAKGDFHSGDDNHSGLVDPYSDNPEDYFLFYRELVIPRPDNDKAIITHDKIKLGRNELLEKRRERMDFIDGLIMAYCRATPEVKPILKADLLKRCTDLGSEYSAIAENYITDLQNKGIL